MEHFITDWTPVSGSIRRVAHALAPRTVRGRPRKRPIARFLLNAYVPAQSPLFPISLAGVELRASTSILQLATCLVKQLLRCTPPTLTELEIRTTFPEWRMPRAVDFRSVEATQPSDFPEAFGSQAISIRVDEPARAMGLSTAAAELPTFSLNCGPIVLLGWIDWQFDLTTVGRCRATLQPVYWCGIWWIGPHMQPRD